MSGTDTFTETENVNGETGVFDRTTDVDGSVTGTRTIAGATSSFTEAVDQIVTQDGNYIDGDIDISFVGDSRYSALVDYTDTSNAVTGTPGDLDHSPTGAPMIMGSAPSLPTGGGAENLGTVTAAAMTSSAIVGTGSLAGASFRNVQSTGIPGVAIGSAWSASATLDGYAGEGAAAIEQYCFPSGTEILLSDGTTKTIEAIAVGDAVASHDFNAATADAKVVTGDVVETYHNAPQQLLNIHLGDQHIATTAGHPFYVVGTPLATSLFAETSATVGSNQATWNLAAEGDALQPGTWTLARDLAPGDQLLTADGVELTISAITRDESPAVPVYNFCVADHHNYHVRLPGTAHFVLVHNESFGLFTYGTGLIPAIQEAYEGSGLQDLVEFTKEMLEGIGDFVIEVGNNALTGAGMVASLFGASDTAEWLYKTADTGRANNTLFGMDSLTVGTITVAAAAAVYTFGAYAVVGGAIGGVDAYMTASAAGRTPTAFEMVLGVGFGNGSASGRFRQPCRRHDW